MRNFLVAGISILRFFAAFILFSLILQKRISITLTLLGVLFLIDIREWFLQRRELESMERVFLALSESLVIIAGVGASFLAGLFTIWDAYGLVLREVFLFLLVLVLLFLFRRFPSRVLQPSPVEHWIRMVQYLAFGSGLVSLTGAVHVLSFLTFILGILSSWRMVKIALLHSEKRKT